MKLLLLVVGKTVDRHLDALIQDYVGRVKHYMPFDMEVIPELKNAKALTIDQQKEREGELIVGRLRDGDHVVLLDEGGRELRSVELAQYLDKKQATVARRLVFIVGGPYGFSPQVYGLAKEKLSLSKMTFSHQMVRLFITEQLYAREVVIAMPPGRFIVSVKLVFKLAKWTFSVGGEHEIETSNEKPTTLVISDRERLWNILFNIDLVVWAASFFFTLPTPWNVIYHVLSDGFFALWILRIIIIRKRYFILTPQND